MLLLGKIVTTGRTELAHAGDSSYFAFYMFL